MRPLGRYRPAALGGALAVAIGLAACGEGGNGVPRDPGVRDGGPPPGVLNLTFEEAAFIASGRPAAFYGQGADPVPVRVTGERDTLGGQRVWRVEMTVEFTREGERLRERWTLWVGTRDDEGVVLRAEGPARASGAAKAPSAGGVVGAGPVR